MRQVPDQFRRGPFSRSVALDAGVTARVLEGVQFRRVHEAVYVHRDHEMTWADDVEAARLALPASARTTGVTRLRELGVEVGSPYPLHFVVEGDLHLALDKVFLHRTVKMPPCDDAGVSDEAAFIAFCAEARLIDAIKVGCYLLHLGRLDGELLDEILSGEKWRRGVPETTYVLPFLDDRCRSIPEGELYAVVMFSGIPLPELNQELELRDGTTLTPDQRFVDHGLVVEFEGSHHQTDRGQYNADIDRYAAYRRNDVPYELVTKERMRSPKATVRMIHRSLVACGYEGPEPDFGPTWDALFMRVSELVRRAGAA